MAGGSELTEGRRGPSSCHAGHGGDTAAGVRRSSHRSSGGQPGTSFFSPAGAPGELLLEKLSYPTRRSHLLAVPHIRQSYNWDCGLACVLMVIRCLGVRTDDLRSLRRLCPTTSIWTVDLAHLLRHFGVDVHFLTITIGANPDFARETFYMENMEEDGRRVDRLFRGAAEAGIHIQQRSLSGADMRNVILSGSYLIVALVDKRKLSHPWSSTAELCLPNCCGLGSGYTGHYVVVCGYNGDKDEFLIRDPASSSENIFISSEKLDEARKSFGTDEDILVVHVKAT